MKLMLICEGVGDKGVLTALGQHLGLPIEDKKDKTVMAIEEGKGLTDPTPRPQTLNEWDRVTKRIAKDTPFVLVFVLDLDDATRQQREEDVQAMLDVLNPKLGGKETYTLSENVFLVCFDRMLESALLTSVRTASPYWNNEAATLLQEYENKLFSIPLHSKTEKGKSSHLKKRCLFLLQSTSQSYDGASLKTTDFVRELFDFNAPVWEELKTTLQAAHEKADEIQSFVSDTIT